MAYGNELRQTLLQAADRHEFSQTRLAEIFGVSLSWVKRVLRRRRQTGSTELLPFAGGKRPKLTDQQQQQVRQYLLADSDATLRELQSWLQATHAIRLSLPTLSRVLTRLDLPRKKVTPRDGARYQGESGKASNVA
jgi:transposase